MIISILFSKEHFDKDIDQGNNYTINNFFQQLRLNDDIEMLGEPQNQGLPDLDFRRFIDALNHNNKWMYVGSHTNPPCDGPVIYQVLEKVYPLEPETHENFSDIFGMR